MARYRRIRLVASAGALIAGVWGSTMALYADTDTAATGTFTTGTLDIGASPVSSVLTMSNMAPGDVVTAPLTVTNLGSLDLRYAMTSTTTGPLAVLLTGTVKEGVTTCSTAAFAASGTVLSSGGLSALTIGDPAVGAQAGDRNLAASAAEPLCFQVALPLATTTGQGQSGSASFSFVAEQTKNN